jgi:beta-galactosidase/beta-glucuronidase
MVLQEGELMEKQIKKGWSADMTEIPRPEHPRPHMVRHNWFSLNGRWQFEFDFGDSGMDRKLYEAKLFSKTINVPFCPESKLSGISHTDFIAACWYRRDFTLPGEWQNGRVMLRFEAVDYEAVVWVNGEEAGRHCGGYSPFAFDITNYILPGVNSITLSVRDDTRSGCQPGGKQSRKAQSHGCFYTRTTGIWQSVWVEYVPHHHIESYHVTSDPVNRRALVHINLSGWLKGNISAAAQLHGRPVGRAESCFESRSVTLVLPLDAVELWDIGNPVLYDLTITLDADGSYDKADGYFGLRTVSLHDGCLVLNGRKVFQRLVLDQGYYPDGIYTAANDDALRQDIVLAQAAGFNGARLHQKVFEQRYLYWADRLGYIVWGEMASWGLDVSNSGALVHFWNDWKAVLSRDMNHPSIVGWCPFNETNSGQNRDVIRLTWEMTRQIDLTRPVIDTSGYVHVCTDMFDVHNYEQKPDVFAEAMSGILTGTPFVNNAEHEKYENQPYWISEYGGTVWAADATGWGYGDSPGDIKEFYDRFTGLTNAILDNPRICGFCYTQLTDVEQEQNGLYTYDRKPKFDMWIIRSVTTRTAAIEG